jgi:hypothetical protein
MELEGYIVTPGGVEVCDSQEAERNDQRTRRGAPLSGTWKADLASFSGKTIQAMLERTAEKEIAGSWRTRGYQGNWWLKGSRRK